MVLPACTQLLAFFPFEAPQEVLRWLNDATAVLGDDPTKEQLTDFVWATLKSGKVCSTGRMRDALLCLQHCGVHLVCSAE